MNRAALNDTIVLGAITGMRSMAGPAALAFPQGGFLRAITGVLSAGELAADKTAVVGDRIDAIPLMGRAMMGALVGGVIASETDSNMLVGGLVGATAAVVAAHVAYRIRKNLPMSTVMGGLLEDAIVFGIGARYAQRRAR